MLNSIIGFISISAVSPTTNNVSKASQVPTHFHSQSLLSICNWGYGLKVVVLLGKHDAVKGYRWCKDARMSVHILSVINSNKCWKLCHISGNQFMEYYS